MKLSAGLTAAFVGCAAAAQQAAEVYILPTTESSSSPAIPRSIARLILLQRLAPVGSGPSTQEFPADADVEDVVALINEYGKPSAALFSDAEIAPNQLVVMLEGMTDKQIKDLGDSFDAPAFTISNPPSAKAHDKLMDFDFYNAGVTTKHQCSLKQLVNPFETRCWSGKSTVGRYDVSKDSSVLADVVANLETLKKLAKAGEMEATFLLLPSVLESSSSSFWSDEAQELRRRQAEQPIGTHEDAEPAASETSAASKQPFSRPTAVPSCFSSEDSCVTATGNCSGHGLCKNKYANADGTDGADSCYMCYCLSTHGETGNGSVTHWAGATCAKQDISVPFWLFAGFTLAMVGILWLAIGLLFSVGEEKLPGVIGAGVAKSK